MVLYAVAAWLRQEKLIPESAAVPSRGWKAKMKEEWRAITGRRVETKRPRHSVDEVAAIFARSAHGDPRLRFLVELAAELRAGQAVRGKRSDLDLGRRADSVWAGSSFIGAGKKHGEVVDLHPELRALVDEVLSTGYLAEAEAAYGRGEIEDYFLFPAGKLRRGIVPVERATKRRWTRPPSARCSWTWRRKAGVEHQEGRAFYGLRRQATDLAPEFEADARVLNTLSPDTRTAPRESGSIRRSRTSGCERRRPRHAAACAPFLRTETATKRKPHEPIPHLSHPGRTPDSAGWRKLQVQGRLADCGAVARCGGNSDTEERRERRTARLSSVSSVAPCDILP